MDRSRQFEPILRNWEAAGLSRRTFLRYVAMGTSAIALNSMLVGHVTAQTPVATPELATLPTSAAFVDKPFGVAMLSEPDNLDVQDTTQNSSASVDKCIYEGLVTLDQNMKIANLLAKDWEVSDDAKEFTFTLQEGVTFHDGEPFNAAAVVAAYDRVLDPESTLRRAGYFNAVLESVEEVDEYTVKFVALFPFAAMVATLAHPAGGIPSPKAAEAAGLDFGTQPVGTGPYKFVSWVRGDLITLEANADYWNPDWAASVPTMTIRGVSEPGAQSIAVQSGDAAFAGPVDAPQAQLLRQVEGMEVTSVPGLTVYWATMNNLQDPFKDVKVRQALNHAIDKDAVLQAASLGEGYVVDSPIAKDTWGYASVGGYEYDVEKAKSLLAEAGLADGFETKIICTVIHRDRAVAIQGMLSQIGVNAEVQQLESAAVTDEISKPEGENTVQMVMSQWSPSTGDADWALRPIYTKDQWPPAGSTYSFFTDEEVESAIQQGLELADPVARAEAYATAQARIMEMAPNIFLYAPDYLGALAPGAGGCLTQADGVVFLRTAFWKE